MSRLNIDKLNIKLEFGLEQSNRFSLLSQEEDSALDVDQKWQRIKNFMFKLAKKFGIKEKRIQNLGYLNKHGKKLQKK